MALEDGKLLAAVNQSFVSLDHPLSEGDEVAFFPPVTSNMENTHIAVQTENFSVGEQYQWLAQCDSDGAVVTLRESA